jgi:hypothetical protein
VNDQPYTNRFADVHSKIKVLKDHALEVNREDAEVRESKLAREFTEIRDKESD